MSKCRFCDQEFRGDHQRIVHESSQHSEELQRVIEAGIAAVAGGGAAPAGLGAPTNGGAHMAEGCIDCVRKEQEIARLGDKLEGEKSKTSQLSQQLQAVQSQLQEAQNVTVIPPIRQIIGQCEGPNCDPELAKQWKGVKEEIVGQALDNIPRDLVEKKALELGLIPQRIVL